MKEKPGDWDLVAGIKGGGEAAFETLVARYRGPVLGFVYRMIGDETEAQDVAQDVFVRAYRTIMQPRFRPGDAAFPTWLFQVARNAAIDVLRKRRRRPLLFFSSMEEDGGTLPAAGGTAADHAMAGDTAAHIATAVARLPEDQRTAFILAEYQGLAYAEIAAVMRSSVKSVEARLYRARRFLRSRLAPLMHPSC